MPTCHDCGRDLPADSKASMVQGEPLYRCAECRNRLMTTGLRPSADWCWRTRVPGEDDSLSHEDAGW